jgi:hypothetical protein
LVLTICMASGVSTRRYAKAQRASALAVVLGAGGKRNRQQRWWSRVGPGEPAIAAEGRG